MTKEFTIEEFEKIYQKMAIKL